jgi:hypothetical protein
MFQPFGDRFAQAVLSGLRESRRGPTQKLLQRRVGLRQFPSSLLILPHEGRSIGDLGEVARLREPLDRGKGPAAGQEQHRAHRNDQQFPPQRPVLPTHHSR